MSHSHKFNTRYPGVTVSFLLFWGTFPIRYVSYCISMYLECILMCLVRFWGVGRRRFRPRVRPVHAPRLAVAHCRLWTGHARRSTHTANSTTETRTDVNACKDAIILCVFTPAITITAHHHRGRTGHRPRSPHCGHARARPGLYVVTLFDFLPGPRASAGRGRARAERKSRTATTARRDWISRDRFVSLEFGLTGLLPLWQDSLTSTH